MQALAKALADGRVHGAEQLLLWGVDPVAGWLEALSPHELIGVRKTLREMMGRHNRVKPGGAVVQMVEDRLKKGTPGGRDQKAGGGGAGKGSRSSTAARSDKSKGEARGATGEAPTPDRQASSAPSAKSPDLSAGTGVDKQKEGAEAGSGGAGGPETAVGPAVQGLEDGESTRQADGEAEDGEEEAGGIGEEEGDVPLYHPLLEQEKEARVAAGIAVRSLARPLSSVPRLPQPSLPPSIHSFLSLPLPPFVLSSPSLSYPCGLARSAGLVGWLPVVQRHGHLAPCAHACRLVQTRPSDTMPPAASPDCLAWLFFTPTNTHMRH